MPQINNHLKQSQPTSSIKQTHRKTISWIIVALVLSFTFAFALVPLYNTFCQISGINGKTAGRYKIDYSLEVDTSRTIQVQFTTSLNKNLAWEFRPMIKSLTVHPGELKQVSFYAKNLADRSIIGRAIPSITPGPAAAFMHKTECFCFNEQPLKSQEEIIMPLVFFIDKKLPKDISEMTLSYTMFDTGADTKLNKELK